MPTTDRPGPQRTPMSLLVGTVALVLAIAGTYAANDQWATAAGVLTGAGVVLALVLIARRRATRRAEASTADRVFGGGADERDRLVFSTTMTVVGLAALLLAGLGPAVAALGVGATTVLTAMPYVLVAVGVVTFLIVDRRV